MWDNTLLFITSDNGGCSGTDGDGANNSPLQGGINVIAMVSGGYLPENRRNMSLDGTIHIADIYATLCYIVGIDPFDKRAEEANLPPIDSINMWKFILGETNGISPRNEFILGSGGKRGGGGIIQGDYKLIFGQQQPAFWTTLDYPNGTQGEPQNIDCGSVESGGCFFDVTNDFTEHNNLINDEKYKDLIEVMRQRFIELNDTKINFNRGTSEKECCKQIDK